MMMHSICPEEVGQGVSNGVAMAKSGNVWLVLSMVVDNIELTCFALYGPSLAVSLAFLAMGDRTKTLQYK
jgi:hypothetical protein